MLGHSSRSIDQSGRSSWHRQLDRSFEAGGIDQELDYNSVSFELSYIETISLIETKVVNKKKSLLATRLLKPNLTQSPKK